MVDINGVLRRLPSLESLTAAIDRMPAARQAASPFVAGDSVDAAVGGVAEALAAGMSASVLYLPTALTRGSARLVHMQVIEALSDADLSVGSDLAVELSDLGLGRGIEGDALQAELAALCSAAAGAGMTVTFMGVRHAEVAETLNLFADLVGSFPDLSITVAANLLRTEGDCMDLAPTGARVRLIKRSSVERSDVAFAASHDVDRAFIRCARTLTAGARTILATHDPVILEITEALRQRQEAEEPSITYQFRRGLVTEQAKELVASGAPVNLLVPFGPDWAGYVARHVAPTVSALSRAARAAAGRERT